MCNKGKTQARLCEVVLEKIWRVDSGKKLVKEKYSSVNLSWVVERQNRVQFISINPGRCIFCDIGHVSKKIEQSEWINITKEEQKKRKFFLELRSRFYAQRDCFPPGKYVIQAAVYSENAPKIEKKFKITWTGNWKETEEEMFGKELKIE